MFSQERPGRLEGARQQARELAKSAVGDIRIILLDGVYPLTRPLEFTAADSGCNGHRIIYEAAPGAKPVISGGRRIEGWVLHDERLNIWKAPVWQGFEARQLFVNGNRAVRARGPASGVFKSPDCLPKLREHGDDHGFRKTEEGFLLPHDGAYAAMDSWRNPQDIEFVCLIEWKSFRCGLSGFRGREAIMKQPAWGHTQRHLRPFNMHGVSWVENAYELLDEPGEWYFDREGGYLYYLPRAGEAMESAEVIAPLLEKLLHAYGTLDRPVEHVRFDGLTFAHGTWLRPSSAEGYTCLQAGYLYYGYDGGKQADDLYKTPSNLEFYAARSIQLLNCEFREMGSAALSFEYGSQNIEVSGCVFQDLSSHAIQLGHIRDHRSSDERAVVKEIAITNNLFHRFGAEHFDGIAVLAGHVSHTRVEHNEIWNAPYTGISFGWGWSELNARSELFPKSVYTTPTTAGHNTIAHNRIVGFMLKLRDGGAIYMLGDQPGTLIEGNYIETWEHAANGGHAGIYFDEGSGYMEARRNAFVLPDSIFRGWLNVAHDGSTHDTLTEDSYTTTSVIGTEGRDANRVVVRGTVVAPKAEWPPEATRIEREAGLQPTYAHLREQL